MSNTPWSAKGNKIDRERRRAAKRQSKAERLAYRRAARLAGVEIDRQVPEDMRGLARTLTYGSDPNL